MHILLLLLGVAVSAILAALFIGACTNPNAFDILRSKVEDLGPELYQRATWRDVWQNLIPRGEWPKGRGYAASVFKIGRSEPASDEESWETIQSLADNSQGGNITTYNQVYVGQHEDTYKPQKFGLMGPLINQDDLTMYWHAPEFWNEFFSAMEKRNLRSISNRLGNAYRQYSYKASADSTFSFIPGNWTTQPPSNVVDLSGLIQSGIPTSEVTQEMLDATAEELIQEGAQEGDTNGWISMGEQGPEFPLYIGSWMSKRLLLNNSELRADYNASFMSRGDLNPVIKRIGAKRVIGNFRHVINMFPARWALMVHNDQINYIAAGNDSSTNVQATAVLTVAGATGTLTVTPKDGSATYTVTIPAFAQRCFVRIPTYCQSTQSIDVTKGQAAVINGSWRDPAVAGYESCEVLNPLVMKEEVLLPVTSLPGAKLNYQNYYGEWNFVTGNDALLGINSCTGVTDPMKKMGRHFAEYRAAFKPVHSLFGRLILFRRCAAAFDELKCS